MLEPPRQELQPIPDDDNEDPNQIMAAVSARTTTGTSKHSGSRLATRRAVVILNDLQGHLFISNQTYRLFWSLVLMFQIANAQLLAWMAYFYLSAHAPNTFFSFLRVDLLSSTSKSFLEQYNVVIGVSYGLLCCLYTHNTWQMLWYSLWYKTLSFGPTTIKRSNAIVPAGPPLALVRSMTMVHRRWSNARRKWRRFVRFIRSFGVRGQYFSEGLIVKEAIELAFQTVQAYQCSRFISNPYLNQVYGCLILANSLSSPLLQYWFKNDVILERFSCVFADFAIDFCWGTMLPLWILLPYFQLFRSQSPAALRNVLEEFPENAQREAQQILILSGTSLVVALFPFVSSLQSANGIKKLLQSAKAFQSWQKEVIDFTAPSTRSRGSVSPIAPSAQPMIKQLRRQQVQETHRQFERRYKCVCHALLVSSGISVFVISIVSSGIFTNEVTHSFDCIHRVHPWFTSRHACVGSVLNCTKTQWNGSIGDVLVHVDEATLANLVITDCDRLELPYTMLQRQYPKLSTLELRNAVIQAIDTDDVVNWELKTLVLWNVSMDADAMESILRTSRALERLKLGQIVNASTLFDGFSNISGLWTNLQQLTCDLCHLTAIPTVAQSSLHVLSLADNLISTIAVSELAPLSQLKRLVLSSNPLRDVSREVWTLLLDESPLELLDIRQTHITSLPDSAYPSTKRMSVKASGTPVCTNAVSTNQLIFICE